MLHDPDGDQLRMAHPGLGQFSSHVFSTRVSECIRDEEHRHGKNICLGSTLLNGIPLHLPALDLGAMASPLNMPMLGRCSSYIKYT